MEKQDVPKDQLRLCGGSQWQRHVMCKSSTNLMSRCGKEREKEIDMKEATRS